MEHRTQEMAVRATEDGAPRHVDENEGPATTSKEDGPVGELEGSVLKGECTPSPSDTTTKPPRRDSALLMGMRQRVPRDDKFDAGAFLRKQREYCAPEMKEVIDELVGFMDGL